MKISGLNEIRQAFLDFFVSKDHLAHQSYPVVPQNDKSMLLIIAGMAPLKPYFTGELEPPHKRMTTCQRCIRTTDIDNVGYTSRHATYFEMLGNFSFGDYFKVESLQWGWEFITEVLGLPVDQLWATVYLTDDESYDIWKDVIKISESRIVRLGKEDNFWEKGTGPCGPCSEIYFDRGEKYGCDNPDCKPGCECDRFIEFWNHVFTQFDKDAEGNYNTLENPNIDTGMGLERIACIMQDVESIFDIDTIRALLDDVLLLADKTYNQSPEIMTSAKIITDHVRAITFMVLDGVMPNNEGRGYVLRKVLRRAYRHGKLLNIDGSFLSTLVDKVVSINAEAYPELLEKQAYIKKVILLEEKRFQQTIDQGLDILKAYMTSVEGKVLSGENAFKLYDTYGFPLDLTKEILKENGLTVDEEAFERAMIDQRNRARAARGDDQSAWEKNLLATLEHEDTPFVGHDQWRLKAKILGIVTESALESDLYQGHKADLILDETVFYPEGGGQVGDIGHIKTASGATFTVESTSKGLKGLIVHRGILQEGTLSVGEEVDLFVARDNRLASARNHTATHLLHRVLKDFLGDHVEQKGSLVDPQKLRFDFSHFESIEPQTLSAIEAKVNHLILEALGVKTELMGIKEAKEKGAMALFGEKYGDQVRVVSVSDVSIELCGGTHVDNIAQIGLFKITSESGIAAGVRRIEAITGQRVYMHLNDLSAKMNKISQVVKGSIDDVEDKVMLLSNEVKDLNKEIEHMKSKIAGRFLDHIEANMTEINGLNVVFSEVKEVEPAQLRDLADHISDKFKPAVVLLASVLKDKIHYISMVDQAAIKKGAHAGNMIKEIAKLTGGGGGGRPNMAQGSGKDASKIQEAFEILKKNI